MLSIETARNLRSSGSDWNPQEGDRVYYQGEDKWELGALSIGEAKDALDNEDLEVWVFAPRLDQLLAEGDKRGYVIEIDTICFGEDLHRSHQATVKKWSEEELELCYKTSFMDERDEAAAQALLWILEVKNNESLSR